MMTDFIGVYENAADDNYCQHMIDKFEHLLLTTSGRCGEVDNGGLGNRKDIAYYFERDALDLAQNTNAILDASLDKYISEHPALGMVNFYSHVVKVQRTPPKGGFHRWHTEQDSEVKSVSRCLVWMIYLNDTPEGEGTTEFIEQGVKLQPKRGTVVFFPADWTHTHRGNPVYTCNKYIATGWYYLN